MNICKFANSVKIIIIMTSAITPGYCAAPVLPPAELTHTQIKYSVVELLNIIPKSMNNNGQIVGEETDRSELMARKNSILWENGQIKHFLTLPETLPQQSGAKCSAVALNDKQQVIVFIFQTAFEVWASETFLWRNKVFEKIVQPSNSQFRFNDVRPISINNQGWMAGYVSNRPKSILQEGEEYTEIACLIHGGKILLIGPKAVAVGETQAVKKSEGKAINDLGHIVGTVREGYEPIHGFFWKNDAFTDIGEGSAVAINNEDHIAGWHLDGTPQGQACIWINQTRRDIGPGCANSINNQDQVVGFYDTGHTSRHAFLWDNGTFIDLNDILPKGSPDIFQDAIQINQKGQILVNGFITGKTGMHSFLLTPVPTPKVKS